MNEVKRRRCALAMHIRRQGGFSCQTFLWPQSALVQRSDCWLSFCFQAALQWQRITRARAAPTPSSRDVIATPTVANRNAAISAAARLATRASARTANRLFVAAGWQQSRVVLARVAAPHGAASSQSLAGQSGNASTTLISARLRATADRQACPARGDFIPCQRGPSSRHGSSAPSLLPTASSPTRQARATMRARPVGFKRVVAAGRSCLHGVARSAELSPTRAVRDRVVSASVLVPTRLIPLSRPQESAPRRCR